MAFESWDPTFRLLVGLPWVVELWLCVGHRAEWPGILKVNLSDHLLDNNVLHMTPGLQRHFSQWMRQDFEEETVNFKILVFLGQCCWPKVLTTKKKYLPATSSKVKKEMLITLLDCLIWFVPKILGARPWWCQGPRRGYMAGHWWDQGWTKGQQSDQRNRHRTQGLAPGDPPPPHSLHSINHIHKYKYNTQIQIQYTNTKNTNTNKSTQGLTQGNPSPPLSQHGINQKQKL